MKIIVTEDDIANGIPNDPSCCPIARAVERMFPYTDICVTYDKIDIQRSESLIERYAIPKVASEFIEHFDLDLCVEPFEFETITA